MTYAQFVIKGHLERWAARELSSFVPDGKPRGELLWKFRSLDSLSHLEWCWVARFCRRAIRERREHAEAIARIYAARERREAQKGVFERILDRLFG